jgi:hypothetical protein
MGPHGQPEEPSGFQREVLVFMGEIKGRLTSVEKGVVDIGEENSVQTKALGKLEEQFHGRMRKIEHTVFGNEETGKIGLAEKVRFLESGWVKLTTGAVLILTILVEILKAGGSWMLHFVASLLSKGAINPPAHP